MNVNHQQTDSTHTEGAETSSQLYQHTVCCKPKNDDPGFTNHTGNFKNKHSRREFRWSKTARDLVRANLNATGAAVTALLSRLVEDTGYPRWACRKFARSMGMRSQRTCRAWSKQEQQRLLKLIDLQPVNEIARLMRRSQSSIWHMLYRLGANAKMGKDYFTVYTLAVALHVRSEKVQDWIGRGWLKTRQVDSGRAKRVVIEAEDFCQFCRTHTRDVVGNRLIEARLDFVYHFVFPPSHATLLPVRESMKESNAYEEQTRGKTAPRATDGFPAENAEEEGDMLGQSA